MKICVFAASSDSLAEVFYKEAFELGKKLAERDHTLIYGGGASGLMGACARGVKAGGGRVIGIAPGFFDLPGILFSEADEMIITETMAERKSRMRELAEAFITLPGGIGSFEEFFETLTLKQVGETGCAIGMLNVEGCYDKLVETIGKSVADGFTPAETLDLFAVFEDSDKLLDYLENYRPERRELWREKMPSTKYPEKIQ